MARVSSVAFPFLIIVLFALCLPNSVYCRDGKLLNEERFLSFHGVSRSQGSGNGGASASCHVSSSGSGTGNHFQEAVPLLLL